MTPPKPLLSKIDCVQLAVPDLEAALAFYRDQLGHEIIWRTDQAVALRLPASEAELVLQSERPESEVDWLVDSVEGGGTFRESRGCGGRTALRHSYWTMRSGARSVGQPISAGRHK